MTLFKSKYPKVFASSVDPYKLSMTIKGVLKNVAAISLVLAPFLNVNTGDVTHLFDSLDAFLSSLDTLVVAGLAIWGTAQAVVGAVRKILVATGVIKPKA